MPKMSGHKFRKLTTFMLVVVAGFLLLNHFIFSPNKKKSEYEKSQEKKQTEKKGKESEEEVIPIKVMSVIRHDFIDVSESLGSIKGGMEFKLTFQIPGTIKVINYREGQEYEKGAILMSLRDEDIILRMRRVEANMKKTQTGVDIVKQKLKDHDKLYKMGAISRAARNKVRLELDSSKYDLEAAALELKANEAILDKTHLYSVSDGMIGELYVEEGEVITANTLLGSHILTEYVRAEFGVIERDMNKINEGQEATILVDAYPDQPFKGVVDRIAPIVGGTSRTATISVKISNKESLLLPGMFARIKVELFRKRNALVIPSEAVLKGEDEKTFVYVYNEEGSTVKKSEIQVGYAREDFTQVDEGVWEGQLIAITSINRLKDKAKVEVIEKQTLEL